MFQIRTLHIHKTVCLLCLTLILAFSACKPSTPRSVMSASKLEDVLYDYSLAMAMADNEPATEAEREALRYQYVQRVFKEHGITEEYFDSTMVWYSADGVRLQKIFQRLHDRFDAEAKTMGVGLSETEVYASYTLDGDTANVWSGSRMLFLSNAQPDNMKIITLPADSAFLPGDSYKFSFHSHYLPSAGMHSTYALFSVYYEDGSVLSQVQQIGGDYRNELNLVPPTSQDTLSPDRLVITLYTPPSVRSDDSYLFYITYPSVLRIHKPKDKADELKLDNDSLLSDTLAVDSIGALRDTVNRRLTPMEERDLREERHDIEIVKERIVRPATRPRVRRGLR